MKRNSGNMLVVVLVLAGIIGVLAVLFLANRLGYQKLSQQSGEMTQPQVPESAEDQKVFYSRDKKRKAEIIEKNGKFSLNLDGIESGPFDKIEDVEFGLDGKTLVFVGSNGGKSAVVVNQKPGKFYDQIGREGSGNCYGSGDYGDVVFNNNGYAYYAKEKDKLFVVHNGTEGKQYECVLHLVLSPDGQRTIYRVYPQGLSNASDTKEFVVVDGQEFGPYWSDCSPGSIPCNVPNFSFDSKRYFFQAQRNPYRNSYGTISTEELIVSDGNESIYTGVWDPIFSSDSTKLAFRVKTPDGTEVGKEAIVVNGKQEKNYDEVWDHKFSPDGKHLAYKARNGDKSFVVLDGEEVKEYQGHDLFNDGVKIKFSPDSKLVY